MDSYICKRGHTAIPYINPKGYKVCRICRYMLSKQYDSSQKPVQCLVAACKNMRKGRGRYCSMHYERQRLTGSLAQPQNYRKYSEEKLIARPVNVKVGDRWYLTLHAWLNKRYGRANKCTSAHCDGSSSRFEWSNISGLYYRDINDFQQLCAKCHRLYDKNRRDNEQNK